MNRKKISGISCWALAVAFMMLFQPLALGSLSGVEITAGDPPLIRPGNPDQPIASIFVTEKGAGALEAGSHISLLLPGDSSWSRIPEARVLSGDIVLDAGQFVEDSAQRTIRYPVITASTAASDIEFAEGLIDLDASAVPGSLIATVVSVSSEGETSIDTAVTIDDSSVPQVLAGIQNQPAGPVTIVESGPGSIMARPNNLEGHLFVILPAGVAFSAVPELTVEGNLEIDSANARLTSNGDGDDNTLDIPILKSTTVSPAQITISNILLTLDRTVPQGTITAVVRGSAVDSISSTTAGNDPALYTRNVAAFNIAECVDELTPEESGPVAHKAVFTLGQRDYVQDGTVQAMDAMPYVNNNRVLLPYRYLAIALGITDDSQHIAWDSATQTMTLTTPVGDVVVNTLGSKVLTVNGQDIQMDTASEQRDGHIYLPARWLTECFGGLAEWVPESQEVWISILY